MHHPGCGGAVAVRAITHADHCSGKRDQWASGEKRVPRGRLGAAEVQVRRGRAVGLLVCRHRDTDSLAHRTGTVTAWAIGTKPSGFGVRSIILRAVGPGAMALQPHG